MPETSCDADRCISVKLFRLASKTWNNTLRIPTKKPTAPEPRKGMPATKLSNEEFTQRYLEQFFDPAFDSVRAERGKITAVAWENYDRSRKSSATKKAGIGFANADYDLSVEWYATSGAIAQAQKQSDRCQHALCF